MKTDANCIFCQIIAGQVPCFKLFEDENTIAIMDIFPANDGHCLVLTKEHYPTLMVSAKQDWGENDRKCYLAFSNALVRTLREIGLEGNPARQPTLAEVLRAERAA